MASQRKVPTLLDLSMQTAIANLRYIGDVGEIDMYLLKDILPHCTLDQLTRIENSSKGRDLSPITDKLWKRFYEQSFGVDSANSVIKRMKERGVVFQWRKLYEAKVQNTEEITNRLAQKLKRRYEETEANKESRKTQLCSKIPPSNKRSSWGGSGSNINVSNLKSNLMKKAKIECVSSLEVSMRKNSVQKNNLVQKSVPHSTRPGNFLPASSPSSSKLGKSGTRRW